jgi:hypothetical protein
LSELQQKYILLHAHALHILLHVNLAIVLLCPEDILSGTILADWITVDFLIATVQQKLKQA